MSMIINVLIENSDSKFAFDIEQSGDNKNEQKYCWQKWPEVLHQKSHPPKCKLMEIRQNTSKHKH